MAEQLKTETVIEALRRNQWCQATTAHELRVNVYTIRRHMALARRDGVTLYPDPNRVPARGVQNRKRADGEVYVPREHQPTKRVVVARLSPDTEEIESARETYGRRLDVALASRNWEMAHDLVNEARLEATREDAELAPLLAVAIGETEISTRVQNYLAEIGIHYVGDLAKHGTDEILSISNFGVASLTEVWHAVLKLAAQRDLKRELLLLKLEDKKNAQFG